MYNILKKHVFIFNIIIYNTSNQYVGFFKWLDLRCSTGITFCVLYCWTNQGFSKLSMDKMIMCDVKWILLMNPQRIITCSQLYVVFPLHDAAQFNSKHYWYFTQFHVYCNFPPIQMGFILDTPGGHQFTFEIHSSANNQRNICTLSIDHGVVLSRSLELVVVVQDVCQI